MACRGDCGKSTPVTTTTLHITRNPYEATAGRLFVSEWYGISVGWQGENDEQPRYLHPSEFYRAMGGDKRYIDGWVDFYSPPTVIKKDSLDRHAILEASSFVKLKGKVSIINAPVQDCGFCISQMTAVPWWDISDTVYMIRADQTAVPYTAAGKQQAIASGQAVFERYR